MSQAEGPHCTAPHGQWVLVRYRTSTHWCGSAPVAMCECRVAGRHRQRSPCAGAGVEQTPVVTCPAPAAFLQEQLLLVRLSWQEGFVAGGWWQRLVAAAGGSHRLTRWAAAS